jgi:hypothetical protein
LEEVKRLLGKRRSTFGNAERVNVLLGLDRSRCNRVATEADFVAELRKQLSKGAAPAGLRHDPRLPGRRVSASSVRLDAAAACPSPAPIPGRETGQQHTFTVGGSLT